MMYTFLGVIIGYLLSIIKGNKDQEVRKNVIHQSVNTIKEEREINDDEIKNNVDDPNRGPLGMWNDSYDE